MRRASGFAPGLLRARRNASRTNSHPIVEGRTTARGLDSPIELIRDRHGVPHVFSQTVTDALFGQGYVHAQDRLFQLESMRRVASGRIAEWGGPVDLESDRFMRRLGLAQLATADVASAGSEERELLSAYSRGLHAGVAALPPECDLVGSEPEPWRPADTMLIGRLLMFSFAANWDTGLLRDRLREALGAERAALLDPAYEAHRVTHTGEPYPRSAERLLHAYHSAQQSRDCPPALHRTRGQWSANDRRRAIRCWHPIRMWSPDCLRCPT